MHVRSVVFCTLATGTPSTTTTHRLVFELKAKRQDACDHAFDKRLAIAQELQVGRFILKIHSDGAIFAGLAGRVCRIGHPQVRWSVQLMTQHGGIPAQFQGDCEGQRSLTTKSDGIVHEGVTPAPHPMKTAVSAIFVGMWFFPRRSAPGSRLAIARTCIQANCSQRAEAAGAPLTCHLR